MIAFSILKCADVAIRNVIFNIFIHVNFVTKEKKYFSDVEIN